jgi:hypothetical protein
VEDDAVRTCVTVTTKRAPYLDGRVKNQPGREGVLRLVDVGGCHEHSDGRTLERKGL